MTVRSEDWLASAACHSVNGADDDAAPHVRLTELEPRQKRELAAIAAAAVTTCTFMLIPVLLATGETVEPLLIVSGATMAQATVAPVPYASTPAAKAVTPVAKKKAGTARRASRPRTQVKAPLPALVRAEKSASAVVLLADAGITAAPRFGRSGSRGLVSRVLLGDGRYRVRPFPTPSAEEN